MHGEMAKNQTLKAFIGFGFFFILFDKRYIEMVYSLQKDSQSLSDELQ
jgi:hypothetical protein